MDWLLLAGGLAALSFGADIFINSSATISRRFGVSEAVIGATLVGFGTSSPELAASVSAALAGSPGIAIGNVVGSNIANILLILGISAMIAPLAFSPREFRRDIMFFAVATAALLVTVMGGSFTRLVGAGFIAVLATYLIITMRDSNNAAGEENAETPVQVASSRSFILAAVGLAMLVGGAKIFVDSAIAIATILKISETIIGLTIVAIGTSLPELVVSVLAAFKGKSEMAVGNVIGSNIFNSVGILGVTAMISPMTAPAQIVAVDIWVMLAASLALLALVSMGRINRIVGAALLAGYGSYIYFLIAA